MSRRLIALMALSALAAMAGTSTTGHAAVRATATTPRCTSSALQVWLGVGNGGAAAGSSYLPLEFTNVSRHSCHLVGYPGVSAHAKRQLGSAATRTPEAVARVTLAPGATAHATLQIVDVGSYPPATCRPATATALRVYPPNDFRSAIVPFRFRACASAGPAFLRVTPIEPHVGVPGYTAP